MVSPGYGQSDTISKILQQLGQPSGPGGSGSLPRSTNAPETQVIQTTPLPPAPPSRIELILSDRAGVPLHQFGYDVFAGLNQVTVSQVGSIRGRYVLGPGDELQISLRGQDSEDYDVFVGNDGNVVLPKLPPIHAAGRTYADFQAALQAAIRQNYISTQAYVSVEQLRQINVTVTGEVNSPGQKQVTGLSSPLDVLVLALGVKKSGSLRDIEIIHAGKAYRYDLYHVFMDDGETPDIELADGDRIVVPTLGKTVAVTGWVQRPGIYELPSGQSAIGLADMLRYAGGLQVRGTYRYALQETLPDGKLNLTTLASPSGHIAHDGDILFIERGADEKVGEIGLYGPTSLAGEYSLGRYNSLHALLQTPGALGQTPYMLLGLISRKDDRTMRRMLIAFSPQEVYAGRSDIALQKDDIVRVFDAVEAARLVSAADQHSQHIDFLEELQKPTALGSASETAIKAKDALTSQSIFATSTPQTIGMYTDETEVGAQPQSADLAATADATTAPAATIVGAPTVTAAAPAAAPSLPSSSQIQQIVSQNPGLADMVQQNPSLLSKFTGAQSQAATVVPSEAQPGQVTIPGQVEQAGETPQAITTTNNQLRSASTGPFVLDQRISSQGNVPITGELTNIAELGLQIGVDPAVVISFLEDHRVQINGAVRKPGDYLSGGALTLDQLIDAAGGTLDWTDLSAVELTRTKVDQSAGRSETRRVDIDLHAQVLASIEVEPRDTFRFSKIYTDSDQGSVAVEGQVRNPGAYDLVRGERLSDLLKQVGGLTPQAFPYGAIFLRKTAATAQKEGFAREADDIEKQLIMAAAKTNSIAAAVSGGSGAAGSAGLAPEAAAYLTSVVDRLRHLPALGRMTVIADPAALAANPEEDIVLQPGDFLLVPARPDSVTVTGEVLNSGSYQERAGLTASDYIDLAGGYGRYADEDFVFIVYPDGSSHSLEKGLFNFNSERVPPGSTIVVPRDLQPVDYTALTIEVGKILEEIAVGVASVAVLRSSTGG